jgi:hypothetical protein
MIVNVVCAVGYCRRDVGEMERLCYILRTVTISFYVAIVVRCSFLLNVICGSDTVGQFA